MSDSCDRAKASACRGMGIAAVVAIGLLLGGLSLGLAGCSVTTGPTQETTIDEPLGSAAVIDVSVKMGAGKLDIQPGATGLLSGTVRYNVASWKPEVSRTDSSVSVKQGSQKGIGGLGDIVNDWQLKLGKAPVRLSVSAGAYQGTYDLGGVTLVGLQVKDGAAKTSVAFASPNPGQMESLKYETGASTVTMTGLANANFRTMSFKGGAGSYTLDFGGELRTAADVTVEAGVGTLRVVVPATTPARLTVDGSLNDVSTEGSWKAEGKTYVTPAAAQGAAAAKTLTIRVKMSVGSLKLSDRSAAEQTAPSQSAG